MKFVAGILFLISLPAFPNAQENSLTKSVSATVGLPVGQKAPTFAAQDQFGHEQSNETLEGSNGTIFLFFRSADWCPFCKAQLVDLQNAKQRFEAKGIKLAAVSYDSPAILKDFADRHNIEFSLLADPDSSLIRSFNVLNSEAKGMTKGMAHPGFFYIDSNGIVREKYFEVKDTDRFTANNVMGKLFPELSEEVHQNVGAPHLLLTIAQSNHTVVSGNRVTLTAEIELPPGVHVYSPGVVGYKPIQLVLHPSRGIETAPVSYPTSKILYLEVIKEQVPVFEGRFRITQDVTATFSKAKDGVRAVFSAGKTVSIAGELQYQACSKTICYPPTSVPVKWELKVQPLDLHRSPGEIRHK